MSATLPFGPHLTAHLDQHDDSPPIDTEDRLLPVQWLARMKPVNPSPEIRLMYAILDDALATISGVSPYLHQHAATLNRRRELLRDEALRWVKGAPVEPHCLTFQAVCYNLGLEPGATRTRILLNAATGVEFHQLRRSPVGSGDQRRMTVTNTRRPSGPAPKRRRRG